ncbi:MAG TPA: hypothetical protein VKR32_09705, partial [Puia sp.]|nr:hypothetical protein [Puia sp.]
LKCRQSQRNNKNEIFYHFNGKVAKELPMTQRLLGNRKISKPLILSNSAGNVTCRLSIVIH